jgi:hypothetical protein
MSIMDEWNAINDGLDAAADAALAGDMAAVDEAMTSSRERFNNLLDLMGYPKETE